MELYLTEYVILVFSVAILDLKIFVWRCAFLVWVGKRIACRRVAIRRGLEGSNRVCPLLAEGHASAFAATRISLKDLRRVPTCLSPVEGTAVSALATSLIGLVIACVQVAVLPLL